MKKNINFIIFLFIIFIVLVQCVKPKPILIGFSGEITGRSSEIGVAARDGAILAVEEINKKGGINGKPLNLIIKDDKSIPDVAKQVDMELINEGVCAIIGHITSSQTLSSFDLINEKKMIMLTPTSGAIELTGKKDYLFKMLSGGKFYSRGFAMHVINFSRINEMICVYDTKNLSFSNTFLNGFKEEFIKSGGKIIKEYSFASGETDLKLLVEKIIIENPKSKGILFISSALDTALLAQYMRLKNSEIRLFSSTWALTEVLIQKGGKAVENLEIASVSHPDLDSKNFKDFNNMYKTRYKNNPSFPAIFSYESALILAEALKKTNGSTDGLTKALLSINNFNGIQGKISFDEYGDAMRELYIARIENNLYKIINTIKINKNN